MFMRDSCLILLLGCTLNSVYAAEQLIISEYVEGSGNNKAVELYNTSDNLINLNGYQIHFYFNGNQHSGTNIALRGSVEAGDVFVISDDDASEAILTVTDMTSSMSFFNGDDAVVLSYQGEIVDSLGQVGTDPGAEWGSGELSTKDNTLRRNDVQPIADIIVDDEVSLANWFGFEKDNISDLGLFGEGTPTEPEPTEPLVCFEPAMRINEIQGAGVVSDYVGESVIIEAIVVSNNESGFDGLFVQSPDSEQDSDPFTSEGIFVYTADTPLGFQLGDRVRLKGTVEEYSTLTQVAQVEQSVLCDTHQTLPSSRLVMLPRTDDSHFESLEGMRVHFSQNLTVNEVYNLGRYGEILLGSERHFIGTQVAEPGEEALAITARNALDSIILDDGLTAQNPESIRFPAPELSAENTVRVGDMVTDLHAIMHYGFGAYRLLPTESVNFIAINQRTASPTLPEERDVVLASFNVLNFFNGDGLGGGFPTARGANDLLEFERQRAKIVAAMLAINADVFGLMEIENDGFDRYSAIAHLVDALNDQVGSERYGFISPRLSRLGDDEISVGLIYRIDTVMPLGEAQILSSDNSPVDELGVPLFNDDKNRPMLTQLFGLVDDDGVVFDEKFTEQNHQGVIAQNASAEFVVAVNHFKSKGSSCSSIGDPDLNDGQGNCNLTRKRAAMAASQWLSTTYADNNIVLMGDLNAYAQEDPLTELRLSGFYELFDYFDKNDAYTYIYSGESGQLDHALVNEALLDAVIDVTHWHINTDEPRVLDYNLEFKTASQQEDLYSDGPFRSSDHDPVLVSLQFSEPNLAPIARFDFYQNRGWLNVESTSYDLDGDILSHEWDFGDGHVGSGVNVSHEYTQSGEYTVTLTVTDDGGLTHSQTQTVQVIITPEGKAPTAIIQHQAWWFIHLFTSLSVDEDGHIESQSWRFDDGFVSSFPWVIRFDSQNHHVELTVVDNDGLDNTAELYY
ncbi:ExeM/NucH family extracellular endonuclease [uncultured Shewanella sp.]|uniref:ExeM/NucH family extracellular endonuclease n=1 Tax=uncultured Shewanella sp. TaxID=173975 RepID=UPI002605A95D|nr:ExeM/NucH family extracellular endonuclease [uncultured Shewanella sp.]